MSKVETHDNHDTNNVVELRPAGKEITVESLIADNHSADAFKNRAKSQDAFRRGEIDVTAACSDARLVIPNLIHAVRLGSIATGGKREDFTRLFNDRRVRSIINLAHFDGRTIAKGSTPSGCRGLFEKSMLEKNGNEAQDTSEEDDTTAEFIRNEIFHSDVIVQTTLAARSIAKLSEKPVMAAAEDHITGKIHIFAVYWRKNGTFRSLLSEHLLPESITPEHYDPQKIYHDGLPDIDMNSLPVEFEVFHNYVRLQEEKMKRMKIWYSDFEERQKVQNKVKAVLWTIRPRPPELRFPTLFREPGSLFLVSQASMKDVVEGDPGDNNQVVSIPLSSQREGLMQVRLPIFEAIEHRDEPEKAFSGTNTLIIETGSFNLSTRLQAEALKKPWMREWLQIPGNKIITIESKGGVIREIGEYRLQIV